MLQQYLRGYLAADEDIEDVIQDTYLRIYGIQDYANVESPKALLITIAHNLAVTLIRSRSTRATDAMADIESLGVAAEGELPEDQLDARRRFEAFCAAVDDLPPVCRRVFVLRKVYRLSQAEISAVLGISESTIEKHVVKGLARCRDHLRDHGLLPLGKPAGKPPIDMRKLREEGASR